MTGQQGLSAAIEFAYFAHGSQVDKAGAPYILHPLRVMERLLHDHPLAYEMAQIAVLHDVMEDCQVTKEELRQLQFSESVIQWVVYLTRTNGETYCQYIERIKTCPLATIIKIADLEDNMDFTRFDTTLNIGYGDLHRWRKYRKAWEYLRFS